jgi:hypothetical protein
MTRWILILSSIVIIFSGCSEEHGKIILSERTIRVEPHEDLLDLACRSGYTIEDLIQENNLSHEHPIRSGQILILPAKKKPQKISYMNIEKKSFPKTEFLKENVSDILISSEPKPIPQPSLFVTPPAKNIHEKEFCSPFADDILYSIEQQPNEGYWIKVLKASVSGRIFICAMKIGKVIYVGDQIPALKNLIIIKHFDGTITTYGCLKKTLVKKGASVDARQIIGQSSNSQDSERQFYFECRKGKILQPLTFFELKKNKK